MENKEILRPNIKKLKGILNHDQIYTVLNRASLDMLKKAIDLMEGQLTAKKRRNLTTEAGEEDAKQILEILNTLLKIVMNSPITPILKDLVGEFIILTAAWNINIAQRVEIRQGIASLRNFLNYHLSVIDTTRILKYLLKRFEHIQKFSPPAFELSRHYLEILQEMEEDKKKKRTKSKGSRKK